MAGGDEDEAGAESDRRAQRDDPKGEAQEGPSQHPTAAERREDRTESAQRIAARRARTGGPSQAQRHVCVMPNEGPTVTNFRRQQSPWPSVGSVSIVR